MSAPVMQTIPSAGGNLLASQSLAASKAIGVFLDLTAAFEGQVVASDTTGGTAASTSGVTFAAYHVYAQTTLNQGGTLTAGSTSATVTSAAGMYKGQKIVIGDELVTLSAISGNTLTISATQRNHADGSTVAMVTQTVTAGGVTLGQNLTAANTTYSMALFLPTGYWFVYLTNTDASNAVTVEMTNRNVTGVQ